MNPEQHLEDEQPQPNRPHDEGQPDPDRDHGDPDVMPDLEETAPEPEEPNVETVSSLQGQDDPESWTQADFPALQATQERIERLESKILHEQAREPRIEPEAKQEEKEEEPQETLQDIVPQDSVSSSVASNDDPNLDGQRRASAEAEVTWLSCYEV